MITSLSLVLASMLTSYAAPYPNLLIINNAINESQYKKQLQSMTAYALEKFYAHTNSSNLKYTLSHEAKTLRSEVINKVLTTIQCAKKLNIEHNNILTVIDYSIPSNQKRLWVFDLEKNKLLYHTYVGHGIKSGTLLTDSFSNVQNSKASSLGVYKTEGAYYGRAGRSLRLQGLDRSFNDNASNRYIVMHGGWYMDDAFIKKYGRSGRSWGCPALPLSLTKPIIETIKDHSLMIMYYPSDRWLAKSKFLNCNKDKKTNANNIIQQPKASPIPREHVLFAKLHKNKAIICLSADKYTQAFHHTPPLKRMLRRRIGKDEYIALSSNEIKQLVTSPRPELESSKVLDEIQFVIPVVKNRRGYYVTEMHCLPHEKITSISMHEKLNKKNELKYKYTINFESAPPIKLSATNRFIRWLGL
ncbi:MAG: murein L,D-transpeptidase catalytic domain family protein [Legionellaceae bacterium]|nr:murein L,D-transpeptidase catalytic domain family protein [Legionellaceae bacterium]